MGSTLRYISEDSSGFLWLSNGTGNCESLWMAAQRFMYLNDLCCEEYQELILHKIMPYHSMRRRVVDGRSEYSIFNIYNSSPIPWDWPNTLESSNSDLSLGNFHRFLHDEDPVRFCPDCLAYCFHTHLFQLPMVRQCPYHRALLSNTCMHCGGILSQLGFISSRQTLPLCCQSCGRPFALPKNIANRVLFGNPDAWHSFQSAYDIVSRIAAVNVSSSEGFSSHDRMDDRYVRFQCHALYSAAFPNVPRPDWLLGIAHEPTMRELMHTNTTNSLGLSVTPVRVEDHFSTLLPILKSIGRHLARRIKIICGHHKSKHLLYVVRTSIGNYKSPCLKLNRMDCPCCAVLSWWRANMGRYFGIHKFYGTYAEIYNADHNFIWMHDLVPTRQDEVANTAMDTFASLAVQLAYFLQPPRDDLKDVVRHLRSEESYKNLLVPMPSGQYRDILHFMDNEGYLPLDIQSTELPSSSLFCINPDGDPCTVSLPMHAAEEALTQCHEIRKSGFLWPPPQFEFIQNTKDDHDSWYMNMSKFRDWKYWTSHLNMAFASNKLIVRESIEVGADVLHES